MTNGGEATQQQSEQKTILIVEDDPILARMYTEKFTFEGFRVLVARDGEEALKVTAIEPADAILLDIMLPRMSGTDFLERYRQTEKNKKTPVIALSNLTEQEERDRAMKLGVREYLVKAMQTPEQVVNKIKKYIDEVGG
jgi:two-component system, sensor histidine kinase and response regulator